MKINKNTDLAELVRNEVIKILSNNDSFITDVQLANNDFGMFKLEVTILCNKETIIQYLKTI